MAHIDGYADFLVEDVRVKLGYDAKDNTHDDEVLARLTVGEKISKSKHLKPQTKYKKGQVLYDKEDNTVYTIIYVAPELDDCGDQTYFVETIFEKEGKYYSTYEEEFLDEWGVEVKK